MRPTELERQFFSGNRVLLVLFVLSTFFFLWQHAANFSWDFASYSLNAQYWVGGSGYFEYYRPPLMPLMLAALGLFGFVFAEYLFIVLVSALFFYSATKLADTLRIDRVLFYFASLSPYVLLFGMINGTELLSFSLFQLFLSAVIERKNYAGFLLGLAFLTRFNFSIFIVLMLSRNFRMLARNMVAFAVPVLAWLAFTFYTTGNALTSIADIYALIFKFRAAFQPVQWWHLETVVLFLFPFFLLGLWLSLKKLSAVPSFERLLMKERRIWVILAVVLLSLYQYYVNPLKDVRYVFTLAAPVAYFSVLALQKIRLSRKQFFSGAVALLLVLNILYLGSYLENNVYETRRKYEYAVERVNGLGVGHCRTMSNGWVPLNYLGKLTEPMPDPRIINNKLDDGIMFLLFRSIEEPDWVRNYPFVHQLPILFEDDEIIVMGKQGGCVPARTVNSTYVERLADMVLIAKNVTINTNPCFTLFNHAEIMEKSCNFLNLKGFILDQNRYDAARLEGY